MSSLTFNPEPYTVAAPRDASVYDRPNVWSRKLVHVWGMDYMSACGRSVLTDTLVYFDLGDVPQHARCQRPGCRGRWPAPPAPVASPASPVPR